MLVGFLVAAVLAAGMMYICILAGSDKNDR